MKITLISMDRELYCFGIRILSACLKNAGHHVDLIFMAPSDTGSSKDKYRTTYSIELLDQLAERCTDSNLVGLSLMSNQFIQAAAITKSLKVRGVTAPVIWGGIQPTVEPYDCLSHADIVCIGEGEQAIVELAERMEKGESYLALKNLWIKTPNELFKNAVRPLILDLDSLPYPDYSCVNHYISSKDSIAELTKERFIIFQGERFKSENGHIKYMTMTSRGCPHNCNYCANSVLKKLYPGQKVVRWRSPENIIGELKMIRKEIAPISYVYMVDDNFTARSKKSLLTFCEMYKKEIGVPFFAQVSPLTIDEEKMRILFENGCAHITMGVETASDRIAAIYNRSKVHSVMKKAIAVVEKYRHLQTPPPTYQFIIDNPYETVDEMLETLRLACNFPRPWHNPIYSLMLFPGTLIFAKTMADGFITDKYAQIYGKNWLSQSHPYLQIWIRLYHANINPTILRLMLMKWVAHIFTSKLIEYFLRLKLLRRLWENPT